MTAQRVVRSCGTACFQGQRSFAYMPAPDGATSCVQRRFWLIGIAAVTHVTSKHVLGLIRQCSHLSTVTSFCQWLLQASALLMKTGLSSGLKWGNVYHWTPARMVWCLPHNLMVFQVQGLLTVRKQQDGCAWFSLAMHHRWPVVKLQVIPWRQQFYLMQLNVGWTWIYVCNWVIIPNLSVWALPIQETGLLQA